MDVARLSSVVGNFFGFSLNLPGMRHEVAWTFGTMGLSLLLAIGYCVIAVNWYFQLKLSKYAQAKVALSRLRNICISCAVCGYAIYLTDAPWLLWRAYDVALAVLAYYTWSFVFRMRGLSLVCERLAQMEELERSAEKYRDIAELLPQMVWTADASGRVDFSNQSWRSYACDGRTWVDSIHPDDEQRTLERWRAAVAARRPAKMEVRLRGDLVDGDATPTTAGPGYRTFIVNATPIVHGLEVKWLGACADIEEQKLVAAEKEKQAKQKSFFLNALSHDLRAPLHTVLLGAHLLKMSSGAPRDDADTAETIDMIADNAVAAGDLVTKLLEFAKAGAQDVNAIEPVALRPMLRQIVGRFQPVGARKGVYVKLNEDGHDSDDDGDGGIVVQTDRHKLERIVSNLVDNAIKYTSAGGVTVALEEVDGRLSVSVSDTGAGIPRETVPFLFDEFYQVNNHERDRTKGFGMGLAICRCLASQLGADVRLARTGPEGSCFRVTLGDADAVSVAGEQPVNEAGAQRGGANDGNGNSAGDVRPDRGRRPDRAQGDHADPEEVRLCGV